MEKPTYSQISFLLDWMRRDEATTEHFELDTAFSILENKLTISWLKRIHYLIRTNQRFELRKDFIKLGLKITK